MTVLSFKGNKEEFDRFLHSDPKFTWDDLADVLVDLKGIAIVFERIDTEKKLGHTQKALGTVESLRFLVAEVRRKLEYPYHHG